MSRWTNRAGTTVLMAALLTLGTITVSALPDREFSWEEVVSPIESSIRGLDVVDDEVVWPPAMVVR